MVLFMNSSMITIAVLGILGLVLYYSIPGRYQNVLLLLGSYAIVALWDWRFALIQLFVTLFHYAYGFGLSRNRQKRFLALGIAANVLLLLYFRSAGFFVPQLLAVLKSQDINPNTTTLGILVPVGLSYYTLQNISYLVDVYRRQIAPVSNLINFALYLSYFPKLLAGPIEYARTFVPKLEKSRVITNEDLVKSLMLIFMGLVRKLVIADSLVGRNPGWAFRKSGLFFAVGFAWMADRLCICHL
jgi:alginate O-acetyltransferase complex protein AlgI